MRMMLFAVAAELEGHWRQRRKLCSRLDSRVSLMRGGVLRCWPERCLSLSWWFLLLLLHCCYYYYCCCLAEKMTENKRGMLFWKLLFFDGSMMMLLLL